MHDIKRPLFPTAGHLTIPTTFSRGIVRLQHPCLRLVCLRERIAALFAHPLYLSYLPDRFLELLHPVVVVSTSISEQAE